MKFSEIRYERPNIDDINNKLSALTQQLKEAADYKQAKELFLQVEELNAHIHTMISYSRIRRDIDTRDEFFDAEVEYFDESMPKLEEYSQLWDAAMLESPFRKDFENEYGELMFINAEITQKTFNPQLIEDMQKENALVSEYVKLLASAQIEFEGQTYTVSQLSPFTQDANDERRLRAWQALGLFYDSIKDELDRIYDELVKLRDAMGKKLGLENYVQLGYWRMLRNCYTKDDIAAFRNAVLKYLVPVAAKIRKVQADRLNKTYPMNYADTALTFRSGNPKPCGDANDILSAGKRFYEQLSPETAEFINHMYDNEMLDVLSKTGKAGGGYCDELPECKSPFIFANFNGTSGDVEVITHEAGHAFANYLARDIVPNSYHWPTLEACEVHSMSMEFFAWPWAEDFFGSDAKKFRYSHLADCLCFIPYGTMVDYFQQLIYENPSMTPHERNELWKKLTAQFMPWLKLDKSIAAYCDGRAWQRQSHIYENPFYYIDYCLAQTMALQFWAMIGQNRQQAWDNYMKYTRQAGTATFKELIERAGLRTPFDETVLRDVCMAASRWLDDYDLSSIE